MTIENRRAPVQGDFTQVPGGEPGHKRYTAAGTITWAEHLEVWEKYAARYGRSQSAERMAERQGFSKLEAEDLLGRPLATWEERK